MHLHDKYGTLCTTYYGKSLRVTHCDFVRLATTCLFCLTFSSCLVYFYNVQKLSWCVWWERMMFHSEMGKILSSISSQRWIIWTWTQSSLIHVIKQTKYQPSIPGRIHNDNLNHSVHSGRINLLHMLMFAVWSWSNLIPSLWNGFDAEFHILLHLAKMFSPPVQK